MKLGVSISKNSFVLGLFAVCTAVLLAGTYELTKERISASQKAFEERALLEVVPRERHDNDLLASAIPIPLEGAAALGLSGPGQAYIARQQGRVVAVILPSTAPDGYSGAIDMIVGINVDGSVSGVRVLSHNETPGLGDKVDTRKSDWILEFAGRSLLNPSAEGWAVKKDGGEFDQFTGATITPRAVVNQVRKTLEYWRAHREQLLTPNASTQKHNEVAVNE
jgi:electron transport complex protein RnfG